MSSEESFSSFSNTERLANFLAGGVSRLGSKVDSCVQIAGTLNLEAAGGPLT